MTGHGPSPSAGSTLSCVHTYTARSAACRRPLAATAVSGMVTIGEKATTQPLSLPKYGYAAVSKLCPGHFAVGDLGLEQSLNASSWPGRYLPTVSTA